MKSLLQSSSQWLLLLVCLLPGATLAAAKPDFARWEAHDDASTTTINHELWDKLLTRWVKTGPDGINRIAYGAVTAEEKKALADYLGKMQALAISKYSHREQRAYWANLYNARVAQIVLEHYPARSFRDIRVGSRLNFFGGGPGGHATLKVEGVDLSLDDIAHGIVRRIWKDPRNHYALIGATTGGPNLLPRAFVGEWMEAQLDAAARAYVNHPRGVSLDNGRLLVSSLYVWFKADFGTTDVAVIEHLKRYAEPELATALGSVTKIADDRYDWSLNDATVVAETPKS